MPKPKSESSDRQLISPNYFNYAPVYKLYKTRKEPRSKKKVESKEKLQNLWKEYLSIGHRKIPSNISPGGVLQIAFPPMESSTSPLSTSPDSYLNQYKYRRYRRLHSRNSFQEQGFPVGMYFNTENLRRSPYRNSEASTISLASSDRPYFHFSKHAVKSTRSSNSTVSFLSNSSRKSSSVGTADSGYGSSGSCSISLPGNVSLTFPLIH